MIIPSINCPNFEAVQEHINKVSEFTDWIHIDVSDGKFTPNVSWGNPEEFRSLGLNLKAEVHLMVENPEEIIESWLKAGAKRIIVHLEVVKDIPHVIDICVKYDVEAMLAVVPETEVQALLPYINDFKYFQILGVLPGPSGQEFKSEDLEKIKFLRRVRPDAKIEVDGGVNPQTVRLMKEAGADILVSGAYIFESPDPEKAYRELESI